MFAATRAESVDTRRGSLKAMSDAEQRPDPRKSLRLFRTIPHPCSYLDNEEASTVFVDPEVIPSIDLLSELSEIGFRRSGPHVYRPDCGSCDACVSVRIPTSAFSPNRRFKRVLSRNQDVTITTTLSIANNPDARDALRTLREHSPPRRRYVSRLTGAIRFFHCSAQVSRRVSSCLLSAQN